MAAIWNVFDGAVRVLVGVGTIKQRLIDAWRIHLATVQERDVPDTLRPRLATLRHAMSVAPAAGGLSAAEVSVRKMSDKEAADHAVRILEIYAQLDASDADTTSSPKLRVVAQSPEREAYDDGLDDLPAFLSRA